MEVGFGREEGVVEGLEWVGADGRVRVVVVWGRVRSGGCFRGGRWRGGWFCGYFGVDLM